MSKLPEYVKVGPYTYTVTAKPTGWLNAHGKYGHCDDVAKEICIAVVEDQTTTADTLIHEVLHACFAFMGLTSDDSEETIVSRMASCQLMVMRDNPDLVAFLMDEEYEE